MADDTGTRRAQHDVQKDTGKTSNVQNTQRFREAAGLNSGEQKISEMSKDAEANDMIHMGSDHRSVKAQFVIPAKKKTESSTAVPT